MQTPEAAFIIDYSVVVQKAKNSYPTVYDVVEVDPETVGQEIGIKDKNGKEIYEGDILFHKYVYSPELSSELIEQEEKMEVKIPDFFFYLGSDLVQNSSNENTEEFVANMEIIGNIHEDSNLLEGE